tara:strand:+ start:5290 stop:6051 length:762 start_codon:yes stop_codon:yes gene_type:complete
MKNKLESSIFYQTLLKTPGKEFLRSGFIDFLFYLAVYVGLLLWSFGLSFQVKPLANVDLNSIAYQKASELNSTFSTVKGFLFFLILFLVLYIVYLIVCLSFFKGKIYSRMIHKHFTKKVFFRFLKYNALWYLGMSIILIFLLLLLKNFIIGVPVLVIVVFFLLYLTTIYQVVFMHKEKKVFLNTFFVGIQRIHKFILPIINLFIIFSIITFVAKGIQFLPQPLPQILSGILILAFFSFLRYYFAEVIKKELRV